MAFLDLKLKCQSDCRLLGKQTEQVSAKTPPNTLISFWFTRHLEGVFISNYVVNFFFKQSSKVIKPVTPSSPPFLPAPSSLSMWELWVYWLQNLSLVHWSGHGVPLVPLSSPLVFRGSPVVAMHPPKARECVR